MNGGGGDGGVRWGAGEGCWLHSSQSAVYSAFTPSISTFSYYLSICVLLFLSRFFVLLLCLSVIGIANVRTLLSVLCLYCTVQPDDAGRGRVSNLLSLVQYCTYYTTGCD